MKTIKYSKLLNFSYKVLKKINLDTYSAKTVSKGLCLASLRGVDSHGIKLLPHYVQSGLLGRKNISPKFKFYKKNNSSYLLDADNGYGITAGCLAIDKAIKISKKNGICMVGVKNSSHPGSIASIMLKAAQKGYIGLGFAHADSLMLTHKGHKPFFGTNPICFVAPRFKKEPFCLDMATTNISWNKLLNYRKFNKKLPDSYAADKFGNPIQNPNKAESLFPIGGYKGFGLAAMIEILCSVFLGMRFGTNIPSMFTTSMRKPRKLGQLYIIIKTDTFVSKKYFFENIDKIYKQLKVTKKSKNDKILLPNDKEVIISKKRLKHGIPIDKELFQQFELIANKYKINLK
tara:strand:- start:945 stop:1979 length:1035 start_codon:yes stop_codon:yes gene_type:complete